MLMVAPVAAQRLKPTSGSASGFDKLYELRSELPAITHVDNSARIQTVHAETNVRYHRLISKFHALTGVPVLINTSFNVRGEPIVCTPQDAIRCFMRTDMDVLVLGNYVLYKELQPTCEITDNWQAEFPLD
jgi:carbamoyltransferase